MTRIEFWSAVMGLLVAIVVMFNQAGGRIDRLQAETNGQLDRMQVGTDTRFDAMLGRMDRMRAGSNARFDAQGAEINARFVPSMPVLSPRRLKTAVSTTPSTVASMSSSRCSALSRGGFPALRGASVCRATREAPLKARDRYAAPLCQGDRHARSS